MILKYSALLSRRPLQSLGYTKFWLTCEYSVPQISILRSINTAYRKGLFAQLGFYHFGTKEIMHIWELYDHEG